MSMEADLTVLLKGICPRVFPDFAPASTGRPYVTYQQIYGEAIPYLGREVPTKQNAVMQVNVWSDTRKEAKAMILQIEEALIRYPAFQASPVAAPVSDFDADVPVYGSRQDFSIWADR
jgi:hypothetical protein